MTVRLERRIAPTLSEKKCSLCGLVRPIGRFAWVKVNRSWSPECKDCGNQLRAGYTFRATLKRLGLTEEDHRRAFDEQGGLCAICRQPGRGKGGQWRTLSIDHCHTTGKFRALLCDMCNAGLGCLGDDPDRLIAAAEYIRRHRGG